tara:strand:- start:1045 stop:1392 length:348 start_codon:yes stop_codon:yes gene_type:complete
MPARYRMIHRIFVQRNGASANAYGHTSPQSWAALATVAGYVWVTNETAQHIEEFSQSSARYRAIIPLGTDVTEKDRIEKVEDRADSPTELFGTMNIDAVIRRKNHLELRMRGHAA